MVSARIPAWRDSEESWRIIKLVAGFSTDFVGVAEWGWRFLRCSQVFAISVFNPRHNFYTIGVVFCVYFGFADGAGNFHACILPTGVGAQMTSNSCSTGNCRSLCSLMSRSRSIISDEDTSSRPEMCLIALSMRSVMVLISCAVSNGFLLSRFYCR